jgi:hypothetical protein
MTNTRTKAQNYTIIGVIATFLAGGGGSMIVWGADQRYAQKEDIDELAEIVEDNSEAQLATVSSVDVLLIQVLDIRVEELETEIRDLEDKDDAEGLSSAEEGLLADTRRELADLRAERTATLQRILARRTQ